MPGVIMENGGRNGSHTNHERDQRPNGVNGGSYASERGQDKGKGRAEPQQNVTSISPTVPNGVNGSFIEASRQQMSGGDAMAQDVGARLKQLPPEVLDLTSHFVPLSKLLTRLAQKTHHDLEDTIVSMADMPVPESTVNGNLSHTTTGEDNTKENINKKLRLLRFAQDSQAELVKALVITNWSRRSDEIIGAINLKLGLGIKMELYSSAVNELIALKGSLGRARLPNPDLKTALEVLTTGKASWMPQYGYIEPPLLTPKEIQKLLENLNTLLSIRLNLHEYDKTPFQFRDYTIQSGRVTFRVAGEFEVDLTIANEDPEAQFWFIDFRFIFWPSLSDMTPLLRLHIEEKVNEALRKDGLPGCYKYLHEMVLTHKISEFRRQTIELARGKWIEGVKVEVLNRSLCIQYWLDRYPKGLKSWIIIGVYSGRPKNNLPDPKASSRLFIRWFRDSKEVEDVEIPFDAVNISAEELLKTIIAKHVNHILTSIHEKMQPKRLFTDHEAALLLSTSSTEPATSELRVQLTNILHLSVKIEPVTGLFILGPPSLMIADCQNRLNLKSQDPATDGHTYIEALRCNAIAEDVVKLGSSVGWIRVQNLAIKLDELKSVTSKDTLQTYWFTRSGWVENWYIVLSLSMSGERWLLIETANFPTGLKIASCIKVPIRAISPVPTYSFMSKLNIFSAALLSHYSNLKALHARRALHMVRKDKGSKSASLPAIYVRLSDILPSKGKSARTKKEWAKDVVKLTFLGLDVIPLKSVDSTASSTPIPQPQQAKTLVQGNQPQSTPAEKEKRSPIQDERALMVTEARMIVPLPKSITNINEVVDRDIAFDKESGSFAFRLRSKVGESVILDLIERVVRVERLVDFVQVLRTHENSLKCETVSLGRIVFTYGGNAAVLSTADSMDLDNVPRTYRAVVDFSAAENTMVLLLERGNPHLRILDHLTKILNGTQGLDGVATLLRLTLPVLLGFDSIETAWTSLSEKGQATVFVRAADWHVIRYNIFKPLSPNSTSPPNDRKVMFDIRILHRKGVPYWYLQRKDSRDREGDDLDTALKPIWNSSGTGWRGMRVSAVAETSGVEELLAKVDEAVRAVALDPKAFEAPAASPVQTRAPPAQQQRQQTSQRQQQPTPNQSQSQGRSSQIKREVVEID